MATIDPDYQMVKITESNKAESRLKTPKGEFDEIFRQSFESTNIKGVESEPTHFVSGIRPVQFTSGPMPSAHKIVDRVQRLMDTMTVYQQKLIENGVTLKEIQPVVEVMASHSESLFAASKAEEAGDDLKTIVNHSLMLASLEIAKYRSGYYNDG